MSTRAQALIATIHQLSIDAADAIQADRDLSAGTRTAMADAYRSLRAWPVGPRTIAATIGTEHATALRYLAAEITDAACSALDGSPYAISDDARIADAGTTGVTLSW